MISQDQIRNIIGATAYDNDGEKVGNVYYETDTDGVRSGRDDTER